MLEREPGIRVMSEKEEIGVRASSSESVGQEDEVAKQGKAHKWKEKAPMGAGEFDSGAAASPATHGGNLSTRRQEGPWVSSRERSRQLEPAKAIAAGASSETARPGVFRAEGLGPEVVRSWSQVVQGVR